MWSTGCSEASESAFYDGSYEFGADWWPVIFMAPDGGVLQAPFYCPALAWNKSRPWYCNISRVYEIEQCDCGARGALTYSVPRPIADVAKPLDNGDASPKSDAAAATPVTRVNRWTKNKQTQTDRLKLHDDLRQS